MKPTPLRLVEGPNLTPLLGVLLVILVTFMAALPTPKALDVSLPIDSRLLSYIPANDCDDFPIITYSNDGHLELSQQPVTHEQLGPRIATWMENTKFCKQVAIIACPDVPYGEVARLVDIAKGAGVRQVIMVPQSLLRPEKD